MDDHGQSYDTLEHAYHVGTVDSPLYSTKLPVGHFVCKRGIHRLHDGVPFETFEVLGITGHSGILFHKGNTNSDSEGCVLLGEGRQLPMITNSRVAFTKFMSKLDGVFEFLLEVK